MGMGCPGPQPAERSQVDDFSPPFAQRPEGLTGNQKRPPRIASEHRVPLTQGQLVECDGFIVRRVIHQDVDAAQFPGRLSDDGSYRLFFGHIAAQRYRPDAQEAKITDRALGLSGGVEKGNRHIRTGSRQGQSACPAQAPRSAGNQNGFARQETAMVSNHTSDCTCPPAPAANHGSEFLNQTLPRAQNILFRSPGPVLSPVDSGTESDGFCYTLLMSAPRHVIVYSRKGCHLCEIVKETVAKLHRRGGFTWKEVDVDSDEQLRRQFTDEVPVVFIDGRKAFKYRINEREFLRKLAG